MFYGNNFSVSEIKHGRGRRAADVPEGNHFGAWLRRKRDAQGLTGEALAFKVGGTMTQGRISSYESGKKRPEAVAVVELARALGADPYEAFSALLKDIPGMELSPLFEDDFELSTQLASLSPTKRALARGLMKDVVLRVAEGGSL